MVCVLTQLLLSCLFTNCLLIKIDTEKENVSARTIPPFSLLKYVLESLIEYR